MAEKKAEKNKQVIVAPLKWVIPDNIITRFASNMIVQNIENEFKVSFFETKLPILLGPSDLPPKEVVAECVASVIVTADRLPKFIGVLQKQLDQYNSIKTKLKST